MAYCKHWHDGVCKDCRKNCHIKVSMARKAAKADQKKSEATGIHMEFASPSPALVEALTHGKRVAQHATRIYSAVAEAYSLTAPWEEVLVAAARLHDIGWVYGQKKHHKVSARIIRSGTIEDLHEGLRPLAALVARYHRRTEPSHRQRRFAALASAERRGVRRMAAILRIADALDFSHAGVVQDLEVTLDEKALHLVLHCSLPCDRELERLAKKKNMFQKVFKREITCQCTMMPAATQETVITTAAECPEPSAQTEQTEE